MKLNSSSFRRNQNKILNFRPSKNLKYIASINSSAQINYLRRMTTEQLKSMRDRVLVLGRFL